MAGKMIAYVMSAYVGLPLLVLSLRRLSRRPRICPLLRCWRPLATCLREDACRRWIEQIGECNDPTSPARRRSAAAFEHVQHPSDPAFCRYQSFDDLTTYTALDFLECAGGSGCLEKSPYSDVCLADFPSQDVLPLETIPPSTLPGRWRKLYTTGWDSWPCQWTQFSPPHDIGLPPEEWMGNWPHADDVWRMDLTWRNANNNSSGDGNAADITFHMCNEMYPDQTWDFSDVPPNDGDASTTHATLKTRAVMWGTEAHENWYLLDYDAEREVMLVYYCAYTEAVDRFDSMAMVLQKERAADGAATMLSEEDHKEYRRKAEGILGPVHGRLQRIQDCRE